MVNFMEIIDRALEGPFTLENDFDMKIFVPKLREVIKKYKIKFEITMVALNSFHLFLMVSMFCKNILSKASTHKTTS